MSLISLQLTIVNKRTSKSYKLILFKVGEKYLDTDILGKIYHSIFGRERNFSQYFIGADIKEKSKLLNYAYYFILAIIVLNCIAIFLNFYL